LAGEDIDWISGPSILCAINLRINVIVTGLPATNPRLEIKTSGSMNSKSSISLDDIGKYSNHTLDYINAAMKVLMNIGVKPSPVRIKITSNLPAKAGLSSSAAVSVAAIKALGIYFGLELNNHQVAHLAYLAEKDELKTGAGQMDPYSCSLGGLIYLNSSTTPPSEIETFAFPDGIELIIVDTLAPRSTADIIRLKRQRYAQRESGILTYARKTEALILEIRELMRQASPNLNNLGKLVTACHETLRDDMMVSTPLLESCISTCLENGALGAKITGTGMGGCMFALVPSDNSKQVQAALSVLPVRIYVTTPSNDGVIIHW
jgi:mevalonate kinase